MILVKLDALGEVEKYPYSQSELRRDNPGTSFGDVIGEDVLAAFGVALVDPTPEPSCSWDEVTQERVERDSLTGRWKQLWTKSLIPADVREQRIANQWSNVRGDRNSRLFASDWSQLLDNQLSDSKRAEWRAYRQALRDVTGQSDPFEIAWPSEPK